jgi:hypothetical protein
MLIMALLVFGIGFIQSVMNLLLNVLDSFNKFGCQINLGLIMGGLFMCNCNGHSYVNEGQWLEPEAHLKRDVANGVVEGSIIAMLNIRKTLIPCAWMFGIVHHWDMENHHVDYLYFPISLWVEGNRFGHLGVDHRP